MLRVMSLGDDCYHNASSAREGSVAAQEFTCSRDLR
jgi:hypothetical protein